MSKKIQKAIDQLCNEWLWKNKGSVIAIHESKLNGELSVVMRVTQLDSSITYPSEIFGFPIIIEEGPPYCLEWHISG